MLVVDSVSLAREIPKMWQSGRSTSHCSVRRRRIEGFLQETAHDVYDGSDNNMLLFNFRHPRTLKSLDAG